MRNNHKIFDDRTYLNIKPQRKKGGGEMTQIWHREKKMFSKDANRDIKKKM